MPLQNNIGSQLPFVSALFLEEYSCPLLLFARAHSCCVL